MPAFDDEDRPKKKLVHEIGQDLTLLSVKELDERVALLQEEIARLEADKVKKQAQRSAADQFFKRLELDDAGGAEHNRTTRGLGWQGFGSTAWGAS